MIEKVDQNARIDRKYSLYFSLKMTYNILVDWRGSVMNYLYQIVLVRGDERRVVGKLINLHEAKNTLAIYKTAFGRYVLEEIA